MKERNLFVLFLAYFFLGGGCLFNLKGNQASLQGDVKTYFTDANKDVIFFWEEHDKGHGRIEHRKCYAIDAIKWLCDEHKWPGLKSIAMVE